MKGRGIRCKDITHFDHSNIMTILGEIDSCLHANFSASDDYNMLSNLFFASVNIDCRNRMALCQTLDWGEQR